MPIAGEAELGVGSNAVQLAVPVCLYTNAGLPPVQSVQVETLFVQAPVPALRPTRILYRASVRLPASLPAAFRQGQLCSDSAHPMHPGLYLPNGLPSATNYLF